jgi:signal transduction histidine kinase/CheY-like chemotaxis protein
VCGVLAVFLVVTFAVRLKAARDDESAALEQRADQAVELLEASIRPIETNLGVLASLHDGEEMDPVAFDSVAATLVEPGGEAGIAGPDARVLAASAGAVLTSPGATVPAALDGVVAKARHTDALVSRIVVIDGSDYLALAQRSSNDIVAYLTHAVGATRQAAPSDDGPFGGLIGAVYVVPEPDDAQLLVSSLDADVEQPTVRRQLDVGGSTWFAEIGGSEAVSGDFQRQLPWLILAFGLLVVVLATGLVESLARRNRFAQIEVANRTQDLELTLAALDRARNTSDEANKAKSQFLSRMSHELRTPLNAVLGFAQVLELGALDDGQKQATNQILKGGRHLLELINEVLDLSRIEAGDLNLSPEPVLVADMVEEAVDLVRPLASNAGVDLTSTGSGTCNRYVLADRQRTKQVILNLLSNAIKYNRPGGTIVVFCQQRDGHTARVSVADTGFGIPAEKLGLVFDPFERLDADGRGIEGSGIGLALSQQLAQAMGGSLGVESTVGQGSTFWLDLPSAEGQIDRYQRLGTSIRRREGADVRPVTTVLHIEDNLANLELIEHVLERHDPEVEVVVAMQGRLGVELAREHEPALILLDLHLPDLAGDEVLAELRNDPLTASIPVVVLSADASPNHVQRLLAAGAAAYLTKPLDIVEFLTTIDRLTADGGPS